VADTPLVLRLPEDLADEFLHALRTAQPRAAAACREFSAGRGEQAAGMTAGEAAGPCREFSTGGGEQAAGMMAVESAVPCREFSTGGEEQRALAPEPASATSADPSPATAPAWAALLALIEDFVQAWDRDDDAPRRPEVKEETLIAFGWRCSAPGCTSRSMLQVHHVVYRSQGGGDERENLVVLCLFHHLRGEHGELATCRGRSPLGVTWRLGPRTLARHFRNERRVSRGIPSSMRWGGSREGDEGSSYQGAQQ
jgi:hypothetical protein